MKQLLLLSVFVISSIVFFCNDFNKSVNPIEPSETGALAMTVHAGTIGALSKTANIQMSRLYIQLSSPGLPTIYDTLSLSGGSAERTERQTFTNLASRVRNNIVEWTLTVESRDQNGTVIHSGDTVFTVPPRDTVDIEMFLAAQYSMLVANFFPIRDSVTGCEIKANGNIINSIAFAKQSRLGDTVALTHDYLQASPLGVTQNIEMNVYGQYWGADTLLYTGDTTVSIVSGQNSNYQVKLKYVGPAALQGAATMVVSLGAVGTVTVDGELEETVVDIDGNIYHTVTIGTQTWMVENLKVTKYNDGIPIPQVTDNAAWAALTTPAYCWYNNDSAAYCTPYGALYNWYVVDPANPKKIAPIGWHVPNDTEWITLENYLIFNGYNYDNTTTGNKIAKSMASTSGWLDCSIVGTPGNDQGSNNSCGFSGLPVGVREYTDGTFGYKGYDISWWSISQISDIRASRRLLDYYRVNLYGDNPSKWYGFSVRCLKD